MTLLVSVLSTVRRPFHPGIESGQVPTSTSKDVKVPLKREKMITYLEAYVLVPTVPTYPTRFIQNRQAVSVLWPNVTLQNIEVGTYLFPNKSKVVTCNGSNYYLPHVFVCMYYALGRCSRFETTRFSQNCGNKDTTSRLNPGGGGCAGGVGDGAARWR